MRSHYILLALCVVVCTEAFALTVTWTNPAGGNWSIPGNWSQGVPGPSDTAAIQLNGTYTVTVNVAVDVEAVLLGAATGVQTLLVNHPFDCGQSTVACSVGVNGFLDLRALLTTSTSATVGLINYGMIYLRQDDGDIEMDTSRMYNYSTGTIVLEGLCEISNLTELRNFGTLISLGAESVIDGDVENLTGASFVSVGEYLSTHDIYNEGLIQITQNSELFLDSLSTGSAAILHNQSAGVIELYPSSILDGRTSSGGEPVALNSGSITVIDSAAVDAWSIIRIPFEQYSPDGLLNLLSGKLELLDTASVDDSVHVAVGTTLKVHGLALASSTKIVGAGQIQFAGDPLNSAATAPYVRGRWDFSGALLVTAAGAVPTSVDFIADAGPTTVTMRSLTLANSLSRFVAPAFPAVTVEFDTIDQRGGILNGLVEPQQLYHWRGGTLTADSGNDFLVPPGALLLMDSSATKTLDGIALVIEGSGILWGTGVLTLTDSARLASQPTSTMNFETGFEMTGSGDFYNSGQSYFDALSDTILIDVFTTNTTMSRTPGTIDVLSGKVVWGRGGTNSGTITIHDGATLIIYGTFVNEAPGTIQGTGTLDVTGANFVDNGTISPGLSPGMLTIRGHVAMGSTARLLLELRGALPQDHDRLHVIGSMQLGGRLALDLQNGYIPLPADDLQVLTCPNLSGQFHTFSGTEIGDGRFMNYQLGPGGITLTTSPGLNLVIKRAPADSIRLIWNRAPGATGYTVYTDSAFAGAYPLLLQLPAADTSAVIARGGAARKFYRVTATLP